MIVYRIQKEKYGDNIQGLGSSFAAGRWHLAGGLSMLYTASNSSLAILEVLAHLPPPHITPPRLILLEIEIPEIHVIQIPDIQLPANWNTKGYYKSVQDWGTDWLQAKRSLAISVPSVLSKDRNILINPNHSDFNLVVVARAHHNFMLDNRLL